jgi:hypothetical protein
MKQPAARRKTAHSRTAVRFYKLPLNLEIPVAACARCRSPIILLMPDRIVCPCVCCPKCGSWVVLGSHAESGPSRPQLKTSCPAPDCHKEFEFAWEETRTFDVPLVLFERRHFYRSELQESGT